MESDKNNHVFQTYNVGRNLMLLIMVGRRTGEILFEQCSIYIYLQDEFVNLHQM